MIVKVGIMGATGRMGIEISSLLREGFQSGDHVFFLSDAIAGMGKITSVEGVPIRRLGEPSAEPVHAWIDFSRPEGTMALLREIKTPVVIGTTGFNDIQLQMIRGYAKTHPVLLAPNTSPGMNVMVRMLHALPHRESLSAFDVVLSEEHHRSKTDSPSGTAKMLAREMESLGFAPDEVLVTRAGGLKGTHTVRLVSQDEEITIQHRVMDRKVFARGALLGLSYLLRCPEPRVYSMADVDQEKVEKQPPQR